MIRAMLLTLAAFSIGAQQAQRDASPVTPARNATASVSGLVTLGDDARTPVRRAVVTMLASDGVETRSTVSDDDGRFTIGGLPAGRYTLQAVKPAHLTMAHGARKPGRPGTALVVGDGQSMRNLRLSLPRGAVLAGRVTSENGEPLPNTQVVAIPTRAPVGGFTLTTSNSQTDDRGEFRIFGLAPGSYLLAALPLFRSGEVQRRSDQEFDAIARTLRQPTAVLPGQAAAASRSELPRPASLMGFAPMFFPGTSRLTEATPIAVVAGDVKDGLSLMVSMVPVSTISGTVTMSNGDPAPGAVLSVEIVGPQLPPTVLTVPRFSRPNAKGEFTISAVAPGRYRIRARGQPATEWAVADVDVIGADIAGLALTLQPGRLFSGRLSTETGAPPASWKGAVVTLQPTTGLATVINGVLTGVAARQAAVGDDGRFTVNGLEPHDYEVRVTLPPDLVGGGWTLASIRHQGRDLRDAPLTFADGSLDGVDIVLTTAVTELAGRFTSESGVAATDYYLVAFPDDRTLWHAASPRIRVMRPAADGAFSTRDLPPGVYRLAALIDVEDDEPRRREFLESIYDAGVRVVIEAGRRTMQELRIK
jgi:hypothetical protein